MRFVYLLILLLALAAVVVFAVQNNEAVTLQFLDRSVTCALPLLVAIVYLLGMVSGWTVVGFLRRSVNKVYTFLRRQNDPEFLTAFLSRGGLYTARWDEPGLEEDFIIPSQACQAEGAARERRKYCATKCGYWDSFCWGSRRSPGYVTASCEQK
jgi:lipopolysaccharide assembly protein A